jgi:NADH-quinone oxidoreductase subunit K
VGKCGLVSRSGALAKTTAEEISRPRTVGYVIASRAATNPAMTLTLNDYLLVSGLLFAIGFAGVMLRRNILIIFMCLELMLNAANLSLVAFSRFNVGANGLPDYNAQVLVFFIITVAAAEVAVGLAIIVALYRARQTTHVEDINSLKF